MGGNLPYDALPNFPLPNSDSIVAPFAANIDTTYTGSVRYTNLTSPNLFELDAINSFINSQAGSYVFSGANMIVVEWDTVPQHFESSVSV